MNPRYLATALLPLLLLLPAGCSGVAAGAVAIDAISNSFAVYQRREARKTQERQVEELKRLREEIRRLLEPPTLPELPALPDRSSVPNFPDSI